MKKIDLTQGNVFKVILSLAAPLVGTSILQFTYNFVDMIWIGGLGSDAVASVGSSSIYIGLGYALNAMVVIGASVKVAHSIGEKNEILTSEYVNSGLFINLTLGIIYSVIIIFFGKAFISFLGMNNGEVEKNALSYLLINGSTMIIIFFNTLYIRLFSSFGNNKESLKISGIGMLLNIVLDPIFIYTFRLGVNGAAYATVLANIVVLILLIRFSRKLFKVDLFQYTKYIRVKEIVIIGFPNAAQRVIFTLINIWLAKIIAGFGSDAIAAQKIGLQIESITFMIIGGFNGATASFIGQNYGARKLNRIQKGYNISLIMGTSYTFLLMLVFIIFPEKMAGIFVNDIETIKITSDYLRIIGCSQVLAAVEMITNGAFIGLGATRYSAVISIGLTILRIPIALYLAKFMGVNGIWLSIGITSGLKGIISYVVYRFVLWKKVLVRFDTI